MSHIRSKDMAPELLVRKLVYSLGYRYRLHAKDLPGKPDIVFRKMRKVIFVHGCFWHQHNDPDCKKSHVPQSRPEYWGPKLRKNIDRDKSNIINLEENGWKVLVIWECQMNDVGRLKEKILQFMYS